MWRLYHCVWSGGGKVKPGITGADAALSRSLLMSNRQRANSTALYEPMASFRQIGGDHSRDTDSPTAVLMKGERKGSVSGGGGKGFGSGVMGLSPTMGMGYHIRSNSFDAGSGE